MEQILYGFYSDIHYKQGGDEYQYYDENNNIVIVTTISRVEGDPGYMYSDKRYVGIVKSFIKVIPNIKKICFNN